jgi:hypothetical protein
MPATHRLGLSTLISGIGLFALSTGAFASAPMAAARSHTAKMDSVKITITSTGATVWGTVTVAYTYRHAATSRTCSTATCSLQIPAGVTAHLSQTATDSSTWPFKSWKIASKGHKSTRTATSVKLKITGQMSVSAVYVVAQSSSSYNGDNGGYGYTP